MIRIVGFPIGPVLALLALGFGCAMAVLALGGDNVARGLVIISPHNEATRSEIDHAFRRWYADQFGKEIAITWSDMGGTSTSQKWVVQKFAESPNGINVDLFFGGGTRTFQDFAERDLLQPHTPDRSVLDQIPLDLHGRPIRDPQNRWHGVILSGFGMIYNRAVGERYGFHEPTRWEDLGDPNLFRWTTAADPRRSGSVGHIFSIILDAYGWENGMSLIVRYGGNARTFTEASSSIAKDVAFGDAAVGVIIDSYGYAKMAETDGMTQFLLPAGETQITADPVGILKGAPHLEAAKRFVDFLLSPEGQAVWMLKAESPGGPQHHTIGRMPVRKDLYTRYIGQPTCAIRINPYAYRAPQPSKLNKPIDRKVLNAYLGAVLIDARDDLVAAWSTVRLQPPTSAPWRELTQPILTEKGIGAITRKQWDDPGQRRALIQGWAKMARSRYQRAFALCTEGR